MRYGVREPRGGDRRVRRELCATALATIACRSAYRRARRLGCGRPRTPAARSRRPGGDHGPARGIRRRRLPSASTATELAGLAAHSDDVCPERCRRQPAALPLALAAGLGSAVHLSTPVERVSWRPDTAVVRAGGSRARRRPGRPRPAGERDRPGRVRSTAPRRRSAPPTRPSSTATPPSSSCRSARTHRRARCSPCPIGSGAGRRRQARACSPSSMRSPGRLRRSSGSRSRTARPPGCGCSTISVPTCSSWSTRIVLSTWDDDPWVGAAYSCWAPPQAAWSPVGPFHACGEHTA